MAKQPISKAQLKKEILAELPKGSPLRGHIDNLINISLSEGIDPRFITAISGEETSFGTAAHTGTDVNPGNNLYGMGPHIKYPTIEAGVQAVARNLKKNYLGEGRTSIADIGAKWAPVGASNDPNQTNSGWAAGVEQFYKEMGGDPAVSMALKNSAALSQAQDALAPYPQQTTPVETQAQRQKFDALTRLLTPQQGPLPVAQPPAPSPPQQQVPSPPAQSVGGLNSSFADRFAALQKAIQSEGGDLRIYSGARDAHEQSQLFAQALAKYGSEQAAKKWFPDHEKSNHNPDMGLMYGMGNGALAADVRGDLNLAHQLAPQFGLVFPSKLQPWHLEVAGIKDMQQMPPPGQDTGGAGGGGGAS